MHYFPRTIIAAVLLLAFSSLSLADSVKLKSGEVLEGDVVSETDTEVVIDVQVTESIKDRKTILREEIESVSVTQPDEVAFEKIKGLKLGENSESADYYKRIISAKLDSFLRDYPVLLSAFAKIAS